MSGCKYCVRKDDPERKVLENEFWFADLDSNPVSTGHMKIIPKRHVTDSRQLNHEERMSYPDIETSVLDHIEEEYNPDGWNIGFNKGEAAGQIVIHLHYHIIPRYRGDHPDPVGGVRNVIPGKGDYRKFPK
jgi:diadenosine tetraphosphate (Ap4A) HIT family hydrolase